jgi:hypothetical protein
VIGDLLAIMGMRADTPPFLIFQITNHESPINNDSKITNHYSQIRLFK